MNNLIRSKIMFNLINIIMKFWKAISWGILIIVLSMMSSSSIEKIAIFKFRHIDKVVHFCLYFVFTIFLISGFKRNNYNVYLKPARLIIIILIFTSFGILMEIFQLEFTTTRSAELLDFVADAVGGIAAVLVYQKLIKIRFLDVIIK